MTIHPAPLRRYGFALLAIAIGWVAMQIPVIRDSPGTPIIVYFFAILLSAWYGGMGPGLLATAVIVWFTSHTEFTAWRVVRLALGSAGGVSICSLAEILHISRRRVEDSEQRYRTFVANCSEGILRFECEPPVPINLPEDEQLERLLRDVHLAEGNDSLARSYGFKHAAQVVGRRLGQFFDAADPIATSHVRAFIRAGYTLAEAEVTIPNADGAERVFLFNLVGQKQSGHLVRAWGTQRDITALKRAREALRAAKESAEAANQAKDHFLAVLSHELRTPLTPVLATVTSLLDRAGAEPEEFRSTLELVRSSVELEARLIDDLLDVSRIARGKLALDRETVDVHRLIEQTLRICAPDLQSKRMTTELVLNAAAHHVSGDPARLQQVLWNLIKNAVKFTAAGGRISISTQNTADPSQPDRLLVEVRDTGIGIEPQDLAKIFNAFEQGKTAAERQFGGLGLGLAISRGVIEAHGGRLWVNSAGRGLGATFTLDLSVVPESLAHEAPARRCSAPAVAVKPSRLRILLIEDDPLTLRVLTRLLQAHQHEIQSSDTVAGALELASRWDFDVLVSDIGLADGTGYELIRNLRAHRPVRAIALTGFGMDEDISMARTAGFAAHMTKPVDFARLEATIQQVASGAEDVPGPSLDLPRGGDSVAPTPHYSPR
jgi:signal transduction histidine kinase/ActR/RegA family two-component response regulator